MPKMEVVGPGTQRRAEEDAFALVRRDLAMRVLEECRTALMMAFRYLDVALWKMPFEPARIAGAIATDGFRIYFNPAQVISRFKDSPDEMARDFLHLILHCVFRQPFETRRAHPSLWSYACDICVEAIAIELCDQRFASSLDAARIDALKKIGHAVESLTPAQLYRMLDRVWDQEGETRDLQELHKLLRASRSLFMRDSHELWRLLPLEEVAPRESTESKPPAQDDAKPKNASEENTDELADDSPETPDAEGCDNCPHGSQKASAGDEPLAESGANAPSQTQGDSSGSTGGAGAGSGATAETDSSSGVGGDASHASERRTSDERLYGEQDESVTEDAWDKVRADESDDDAWLDDEAMNDVDAPRDDALRADEMHEQGRADQLDDEAFESAKDLLSKSSTTSSPDEAQGEYEEAPLSDVDRAAAEREWEDISKRIEADLETMSHRRGTAAGNLMANLTLANRSRINYVEFLRQFARMAEDMCLNDEEFDYVYYLYGLERYGNMPLIEPLEYKESNRVREFVIAIDTSASCAGDLVRTFVTRTFEILKESEEFGSTVNVHIIQCDAAIQQDTVITSVDEFTRYLDSFTVKGLGGTDFRPVFSYVDELVRQDAFEDLRGLIYFTDGEGLYPDAPPDYDVAFVFVDETGVRRRVPPWAMRVVMDEFAIRAL